jgi:hypothetical protein
MATDALNRRLRHARPCSRVGRLVLTEADYLLFEAIDRHGPLPTNYLYEFTRQLRHDRSHLQNRLTEFYNGDCRGPLLTRPPQQFAGFEARYQHLIYELSSRACLLLAERGRLNQHSPKRTDPFLHRLMGACVGASIELAARTNGIRYIPREEIFMHPGCADARASPNPLAIPLLHEGAKALIPDDLFGLEYPGVGFRFLAVEIDRNTESIERRNLGQAAFGRKMEGYSALLRTAQYRAWWGIPNLHVLIVTTSLAHARNMLDYLCRHVEPVHANRFAIAIVHEFGANWRVPKSLLSTVADGPWSTPVGDKIIWNTAGVELGTDGDQRSTS